MKWPLNRKGQSIVELALITPIVLVALYVPFDFGVSIYAGHLTQNVARDGARRAATMIYSIMPKRPLWQLRLPLTCRHS